MAMRVITACGGSVRGKTIAVLGLTFKPETDDMRKSPSIPIVSRLVEDGAVVRAFDPEGMTLAGPLLPEAVVYCRDALDAAAGADALVLITEWNEFRAVVRRGCAIRCEGRWWWTCATFMIRWRCVRVASTITASAGRASGSYRGGRPGHPHHHGRAPDPATPHHHDRALDPATPTVMAARSTPPPPPSLPRA